jgi:hypothetical protein
MRLTSNELKELLKRPHVAARNAGVSDPRYTPRKVAVMEPALVDVSLGAASVQKTSRPRFRVSITSIRNRLIDEDNLAGKFCTDLCRTYGYIPNDNAETTKIEVSQRKCEQGEPEHVTILIERI